MKQYPFKAGAGSAAIKFPQEMFPTDRLYGVHADPFARILVLDGGERAAIAAVEHVSLGKTLDDLRQIIADETGTPYENVWIHVTHAITTPHPPIGMGPPPGMGQSREKENRVVLRRIRRLRKRMRCLMKQYTLQSEWQLLKRRN